MNLIDHGKNDATGKLAREQSLCRPGEAGELHPAGLPGPPAPGGMLRNPVFPEKEPGTCVDQLPGPPPVFDHLPQILRIWGRSGFVED